MANIFSCIRSTFHFLIVIEKCCFIFWRKDENDFNFLAADSFLFIGK